MRYYSYIRENIYTKGKISVIYTAIFQKKTKKRPVTKSIGFVTDLYSLFSHAPRETKVVLQKNLSKVSGYKKHRPAPKPDGVSTNASEKIKAPRILTEYYP